LHAYRLDGVHRGYIGGMLLEKFYNRGWVDYVLLVLTLHRASYRRIGRPKPASTTVGG